MNMKTISTGMSLSVIALFTACGTTDVDRRGEPTPSQGVQILSADSKGGLVVRYTTPELSFTLEGALTDDGVWSRLRAPDGAVLAEIALPSDLGELGSPAMMGAIDEVGAAVALADADADRYRAAVESIVPILTTSDLVEPSYADASVAVAVQEVLVLAAAGNGGASESAPCPEYLTAPQDHAYHTMADHQAMIAQLPPDELAKTEAIPCKWYQVCCWHDYACILCGAGMDISYQLMCGPTCEVGTECMGRCGGGCAE
jgi:hypothetical protein